MKRAVKSGLPAPSAPIEWATIADGILYTAQIPIKADGSIETGDIGTQTRLTLDNLKQTLKAAGGRLDDVAQVLVYLPDPKDFPGMNAVYGQYFARPYPNRATIVAQLMVPDARIEIVAYAHIGKQKPRAVAGRNVSRKVARKTSRRPKSRVSR
jgi:enamine deaminase RidA (YjgF/YER057c/UK114 family)